jgi:hypothetical protein
MVQIVWRQLKKPAIRFAAAGFQQFNIVITSPLLYVRCLPSEIYPRLLFS